MADDIQMVSVNSTLLNSVGFDPETGEGRASFVKSGAVYGYPGCTQEEFDQILNGAIGGSAGQTFNALWKFKAGYYRIA